MKFYNECSFILKQLKTLNSNKELISTPHWRVILNNINGEAIDFLDLHNIHYSPYLDDDHPHLLLKTGDIEHAVEKDIHQLNSSTPYLTSWLPFESITDLANSNKISISDIIKDQFITDNIIDLIIYDLKNERLHLTLKTERNGVYKFYDDIQEVGVKIYSNTSFSLNLFGCDIPLLESDLKHREIIKLISSYWERFSRQNQDLFINVDLDCYVRQFTGSKYLFNKNWREIILSDHWFRDESELMEFYNPLLKEWADNFPSNIDRLDKLFFDLIIQHVGHELILKNSNFVNYGELIRGLSSEYLDQGCTDYEALEVWEWNWLQTISLRLQINCEIATEDYEVFKGNDNALLMASQTPVYSAIWSDVRFLAIYDHILELWALDIQPKDLDETYNNLFGEDDIIDEVKEIFLMPTAEQEEKFYKRLYQLYPYIIKRI